MKDEGRQKSDEEAASGSFVAAFILHPSSFRQGGARMVTRTSRYGWLALGGLLCLFGAVFVCKVRDGNRALAQASAAAPAPVDPAGRKEPPTMAAPLPLP